MKRAIVLICLAAGFAVREEAAETRKLNLTDAVKLAIGQNRALKIARLKVQESEHKQAGEHAQYFPRITNQSNALHVTHLEHITLPAGTFGVIDDSLVPNHQVLISQGGTNIATVGTQITQPLTQLIRVRQANIIAAAETASTRDDLKKAETQVALQVHTLYFGILIARLEKQAAEKNVAYATEHSRETEDEVTKGAALRVSLLQSSADVLEDQQTVLTADLQISDLTTQLNDVLGLPLDTQLDLDTGSADSEAATLPVAQPLTREAYLQAAESENPEIAAAEQAVRKARAGVATAKSEFIPDVSAFARDSYQNGVPFLVSNFGTFGVNVDWDIFDFGKRRAEVAERQSQLAEAEENLKRIKEETDVAVERSYNKVERTRALVRVADQAATMRVEAERLAGNQLKVGVINVSDNTRASAQTLKARADLLQATLGYHLAIAELEQAVGRTPGF